MSELHGRYPGGPSRKPDPNQPARRKANLSSVEAFEARAAASTREHTRRARRKRLYMGISISVLLAVALGGYLGFSSHRSHEELAREMEGVRSQGKTELDRQMDRLIDEMWKSEALEKTPRVR